MRGEGRRYAPTYAQPLLAGQAADPGYAANMSNRTYRITEIVGTSPDGVSEAIENGIARAGETLRHLDWFEVEGIRGQIVGTDVSHYQVTMKLGFRLEDQE
jgi:flavin-binding protein dodecin